MGVYHGNVFRDGTRGMKLRNIGISYKWMENGIMLPVVSLVLMYKKPAVMMTC
jgi:acyl-CoA thioesterase FadM